MVVVTQDSGATGRVVNLVGSITKQTITHQSANTTERAVPDALSVLEYHHIILLCSPLMDVEESDARTLITLLHLRNIAEETGVHLNIVSEMLDVRNRALAEVARADVFIVSDKLVSLMLSQLSENKHLHRVFIDLFRDEGSEIYLKPVGDYVETGSEMDFYTLLHGAAERGETVIGYRLASEVVIGGRGD